MELLVDINLNPVRNITTMHKLEPNLAFWFVSFRVTYLTFGIWIFNQSPLLNLIIFYFPPLHHFRWYSMYLSALYFIYNRNFNKLQLRNVQQQKKNKGRHWECKERDGRRAL